jgi:hypothetical protein
MDTRKSLSKCHSGLGGFLRYHLARLAHTGSAAARDERIASTGHFTWPDRQGSPTGLFMINPVKTLLHKRRIAT